METIVIDPTPYEDAWSDLVARLKRQGRIPGPRLEQAFLETPRWRFVHGGSQEVRQAAASNDRPITLPQGQTISAPHMVAILLDAAQPQPGDNCLEIGAGSGWLAAVLARTVRPGGHVVSMEIVPELAQFARENLEDHPELDGWVEVVLGDGSMGYPTRAPYDVIVVSCAAPQVPPPLQQQLATGGRLVIPAGARQHQRLRRLTRTADGFRQEDLGGCAFVPLKGRHGW